MYGSTPAGTTLAATGAAANTTWLVLSGFALIALGMAVMRITPRRKR